MWILTQNGKRILGTEGLDEIMVSDPAEGKSDYAIMLRRRMDGKPFALGFYSKRERAVEILKEIFNAQAEYFPQKCDGNPGGKSGNIFVPPKVYEMPVDSDFSELQVGRMR